MPAENLPPLKRLGTDAASVSIASVGDHLREPPNAVSTGGEAAEPMACVRTLVAAKVFGNRPSSFVLRIMAFYSILLKLNL